MSCLETEFIKLLISAQLGDIYLTVLHTSHEIMKGNRFPVRVCNCQLTFGPAGIYKI
jgi:hypothetical protein